MLKTMQELVKRLEEAPLSLIQAVLIFLSIVFLRNYLEVFSDTGGVFVNYSHYFIHYPLFYLTAYLMIVVSMHLTSRTPINKVAKTVLAFFPILFLTPVLDLMYSGGYDVNYFYGNWETMLRSFLSFYGDPPGAIGGASFGMRSELATMIILTMTYVYLKSKSILRSIIHGSMIYTLIFILGCTPQLFAMASDQMLGSGRFLDLVNHNTFTVNRSVADKMALIITPISLAFILAWAYLSDPDKFHALARNIRPLRLAHYESMLTLGVILAYKANPSIFNMASPFTYLIFLNMLLSVALTWMSAVNLNDLWDLTSDKMTNKGRPLPTKTFKIDEYTQVTAIYLLGSVFYALSVSYEFLVLIIVCHVVSVLYSMPPVRLKKYPIVSKACIGLASMTIMYAGYAAANPGNSLNALPAATSLFIFAGYTLASHVIELKDYKSDKATGIRTLPVVLGLPLATKVTGAFVGITYLATPFVFSSSLTIPAILFAGYSVWAVNRAKDPEYYVLVAYVIYALITLTVLVNIW
ncbi:UbiA family prenyltransferase [Candidatus Altiarchaeota archaeon]